MSSESLDRSQLIEQIFERVEAESARRAEAAEEEATARAEAAATAEAEADAEASELNSEEADSVPSPISPSATISPGTGGRQRRRGSVSVSRFGMPTESCPEGVVITTPLSPSSRPSRSSSIVIQQPKMYNVQAPHHGSGDSLASDTLEDPAMQIEDQEHSTTMATIAGKQSISKAISQRLSRARTRSRDVLTSANNSVIIGVAVEEATVEHQESGDETPPHPRATVMSTVEAPDSSGLKKQRSTPKLDGSQSNWMSKAKELTSRFKRKSMAALSQVS